MCRRRSRSSVWTEGVDVYSTFSSGYAYHASIVGPGDSIDMGRGVTPAELVHMPHFAVGIWSR